MKKRILSLLLAVCTVMSMLTLPAAGAAGSGFTDISDRATAIAAESLRLMGVMDGYNATTFNPEGQVTRAQFCKMAVYAMNGADQLGRYRTVTVYPDVKPSYWAAPYINMASDSSRGNTGDKDAVDNSIIKGYVDGKFHPENTMTYGQGVTILMRMLGYKDSDVGGVWPDGYLSQAAAVGLTEGVASTPGAPLTRGVAARLMVNMFNCDKHNGNRYCTTIAKSVENVILSSSSATAPDGSDTAMQLSNGSVYAMSKKISTGVLNGMRGTLLLDNAGKVLTFVPQITGTSSRVVTFASGTASKLVTQSGETIPIDGAVKININGEEGIWQDKYSWLSAGVSLTLNINASGGVDYIFVGSSTASSTAVIAYERGSAAGFNSLTGGNSRYSIYKNGTPATNSDIRPYDVATYSPGTNSIRLCDVRLTGVYENASPSLANPSKITVMGTEFSVLSTAADTMSKLKLGQTITLLLTEDNQVAGAVEAGTSGAAGNAVGIISDGGVRLLSGMVIKGTLTATGDELNKLKGQLVSVASSQTGKVSVTRMVGSVPGDMDVAARKVGNMLMTDNVAIYQTTSSGVQAITIDKIPISRVSASGIISCRTNWAGKIDLILVSSLTGSDYRFGRLIFETTDTKDDDGKANGYSVKSISILTGPNTKLGPFNPLADTSFHSGDWVAVQTLQNDKEFGSIYLLTKFQNIANSAWAGESSVTIAGRSYAVPSDVLCYNRGNNQWMTLNEAHAFATSATLYADKSGYIRVVEVQ